MSFPATSSVLSDVLFLCLGTFFSFLVLPKQKETSSGSVLIVGPDRVTAWPLDPVFISGRLLSFFLSWNVAVILGEVLLMDRIGTDPFQGLFFISDGTLSLNFALWIGTDRSRTLNQTI